MSGHKRATITISEDEYRRLHQAEMKLRFAPQASPQGTEDHHQALVDGLRKYHKSVIERQERYERSLAQMDRQIHSLETQSAAELIRRQAEFTRTIEKSNTDLWDRTKALVMQESQRMQDLVAAESQVRHEQISAIQGQMQDYAVLEAEKTQIADTWLQAAETLADFIHQNYKHDFFTPGRLEQADRSMDLAAANLDAGMAEAALSLSQQAYLSLSTLRLELEQREAEWEAVFRSCYLQANQIEQDAEAAHFCPAHDLDGEELSVDIDVNYWSSGELGRLVERVNSLLNKLDLEPAELGSGDLADLIETELPKLRQGLQDAVYHARLAALNSQLRINIADLVIQALQRQGYALQDAVYSSDDMRRSYAAKVKNMEGSEIVVRVDPDAADVGRNELHLISLDKEMRTEHELVQRSREISQSLNQFGLEVSDLRELGNRNQTNSAARRPDVTRAPRRKPSTTRDHQS
jgi:hypothetical protein